LDKKQQNAIAINTRLNYLIDLNQLSPIEIVKEMNNKVSLNFVKNILNKRTRIYNG